MFRPLLGQRSVTTDVLWASQRGNWCCEHKSTTVVEMSTEASGQACLCHGCCARHGRKRTSASITVPVYGDTAHSRRHVTARPTSKKGGTLISLRIISWKNTSSAARASIYVRLFHCLSKAKKLKTVRCFPPKMLFRLIKRLAAALAARLSTRRRERLHSQVPVAMAIDTRALLPEA